MSSKEQQDVTIEVEPEETIIEEPEEVDPLTVIGFLQEDLSNALKALDRIAKMKPANMMIGGPNNKNFGKAFKMAFEKAQEQAKKTLKEIAGEEDE